MKNIVKFRSSTAQTSATRSQPLVLNPKSFIREVITACLDRKLITGGRAVSRSAATRASYYLENIPNAAIGKPPRLAWRMQRERWLCIPTRKSGGIHQRTRSDPSQPAINLCGRSLLSQRSEPGHPRGAGVANPAWRGCGHDPHPPVPALRRRTCPS